MTKIFFIGDTHFGKVYPYRKNYVLNISERNFDVINNCAQIVQTAIQENADFVIFLGDLYDRKVISATTRKIVREKIFIPLNKHNIKTIIIGGNHDSIRNPERGADIQELANFSNVDVFTGLKSEIIENNGIKIGFIFLPYIHFDVLVNIAKEKKLIQKEYLENKSNYDIAQRILKNYIKQMCDTKLKECNKRILIGHFYLDGAKIRETNNPSIIYGEFKFTKNMVQKEYFDLVMFGHLHLKQTMWNDDRIVIPGSIDRIDMGERDSEKYYSVYDVEKDDLELRKIECRTLIKHFIEIPDNTEDLTRYIIERLPKQEHINDAVCKVSITYPKGKEINIDKKQIDQHFRQSFHADLTYTEQEALELKKLRELNLNPVNLYQIFLEKHYADNKYYEDLQKIGLDLLQKQLTSVDLTTKGPITIKSIDLQNFNKYGKGPNKVVFDKDLYVIKGPTGAGKSSILDAVTFALFKRSTRTNALKIEEILYEKGYVNLELLIGDKVLNVKRRLKSPKLEIKLNGEPLYLGLSIPEKEKKLENIIGYDYEAFISSFFIRQQELQIFSSLSSAERHKRLIKLFKLGIFESIYKSLKDSIQAFIKEHDNLEGRILEKGKRSEELPEKEEKLKEKNGELEVKEKDKKQLLNAIETLRKKTEVAQNKASKYVDTQKRIEEKENEIKENEEEIQQYKDLQVEFSNLQDKLTKLKDFKKERQELEKRKDELEAKHHEKELLISKHTSNEELSTQIRKQYQDLINDTKKQIEEKVSRLSSLDTTMTKDTAFKTLKDDGILTERLNRLQIVEIPMAKEYNDNKRINEFTSLEIKTEKDLKKIQPKKKKITKDIFLVDELKNETEKLEDKIKSIDRKKTEEFEAFNEKVKGLNTTLKEKGLDSDLSKKLKDMKSKLTDVQKREEEREHLEEKLKEKKDYSLLIEKTEKDLEKMRNTLNNLQKDLTRLEPSYQEYLDVADEFGKRQNELTELESKIEGVKVEIKYITKEINDIKKIEDEIKKIKKEIKLVKNKIEKYTILRQDIFHSNGVPKFAIEKILPAISIKASEILSDLTDGRFSQITFRPIEIKGRVGFEIYVYDGEREREVSTFSGGEKTQINAAIRFAIMERIAEIPDTVGAVFRKSNTLFIDEGDLGTLDDETARQRFVEKILELKSMFKKIILITHLEDVAEQFPNRIVIEWDELGNSKIYH